MPPSKTFKIKQNDTKPPLRVTLKDSDIQYDWASANTNTADVYEGEFQVTYADSSIQTFPNDGYILIDVKDDVE